MERNPIVEIKRKPEKKAKPKPIIGPLQCQICKEKFAEIRELVVHTSSSHVGATLICPFEGCNYSSQNIIQLRTHQYQLQHFLIDQENNSQAKEESETPHEESKPSESLQPDENDIVGFSCSSCPYEARLIHFNGDMNLAMEALFCHQENTHGTSVDQLQYKFISSVL